MFDYVTTPGYWPQWHPSSRTVAGTTDHSMDVGESCTEVFVVAGRTGSCVWTARECVRPRRWVIETETQGAAATITYEIDPLTAGTAFVRTLAYRMPNAALALLDALVLRRRIEAESAEALRRLKAKMEQDHTSAPPPRTSSEQAPEE